MFFLLFFLASGLALPPAEHDLKALFRSLPTTKRITNHVEGARSFPYRVHTELVRLSKILTPMSKLLEVYQECSVYGIAPRHALDMSFHGMPWHSMIIHGKPCDAMTCKSCLGVFA